MNQNRCHHPTHDLDLPNIKKEKSGIRERIQELKDFLIIAWEKYNGDWFEVPDELFAKYGLDPCDMDDRFYFGSALKISIQELEKFSEAEDK